MGRGPRRRFRLTAQASCSRSSRMDGFPVTLDRDAAVGERGVEVTGLFEQRVEGVRVGPDDGVWTVRLAWLDGQPPGFGADRPHATVQFDAVAGLPARARGAAEEQQHRRRAERRIPGERDLRGPRAQREHDRLQLTAPRRQLVDGRTGGRRQRPAGHDAPAFKLAKPVGDQVGAGTRQRAADVGKPLRPQEKLTHDEQRPPLSDDVERAGGGARVSVAATGRHDANLQP